MYAILNILLERNLGPVPTETYPRCKRRSTVATNVLDEDEVGEIWRATIIDCYKPIIEDVWQNPTALPLLGVSRMATTVLVLLTEEVNVTDSRTGRDEIVTQDNFRMFNCGDTVTGLTTNYKNSKKWATLVNIPYCTCTSS